MKIGAVINTVNIMLKGNEIEYIINHAEPTVLIVEDALTPNVDSVKSQLSSVRHYYSINLTGYKTAKGWHDASELLKDNISSKEPLVIAGDNDPVTLLYTSGTETKPKGVLASHIGLHFSTMHIVSDIGLGKDDVLLLVAPLYHIAGILLVVTCIYIGAKLVVDSFPEPANIMDFTKNQKVTFWTFPPTTLAIMPHMPGFSAENIKTVRGIIAFGSALPKAIAELWKGILPNVKMVNYYGQTESGPLGTLSTGDDIILHPGSIGKPHRLIEIKIFDHADNEVEIDQVGEIVMRGPSIMLGYLKDKEKTLEAFRNGWLHTGDLAKKDQEGFYHFVDRRKDIIKTGSENVSSMEIEQLLFSYPKVLDAAVIGLPDAKWGEVVTAVVVPKPNEQIQEEELIKYCKDKVAGYKVPKKVIVTDAIQRNPAGKVLKTVLRDKYIIKK
jgi:fatty-acyl-CoA synthase